MVVRLGNPVRIFSLFVLGILSWAALAQSKFFWMSVGSIVFAFLFVVYAWSYRTHVTAGGIAIRYFPFFSTTFRWSDFVQVIESLDPLCITAAARFRIWGLTPKTRIDFLELVPHHLLRSEPDRPSDVALREAKKYWHATKIIGMFWVLGTTVLVPFLDNSPFNRYWRPFGQAIVLAVGGLWLALLFTGGMAFIHWRAHRDLRKHSHPEPTK